jgi:predicted transcriptional regulator YdeE
MLNEISLAITLSAIVLTLVAGAGDMPSQPRIVNQKAFTVVGISARTSNAKEVSGQNVIAKQWERIAKDSVFGKIPNKADSGMVAVYLDYESDANGAYTLLLGARVSSVGAVPAGMVAAQVPAGRYAVFTSKKGPLAKVVPETWARIWSTPKSVLGGDRAYRADFELYDVRGGDPQNGQVAIYVGIK